MLFEGIKLWFSILIMDKETESHSFLDLFLLAMNVISYSLSKPNDAVKFL